MSKTMLGIRYKNDWFVSKIMERTEEELSILKEVCENAAKGNIDYLTIEGKNGYTYYVSRKILKKSIISIIEE